MVASGKQIIDQKWVTFPETREIFDTEEQIQPNGVDLRVESISQVGGKLVVPRDGRITFDEIQNQKLEFKHAYTALIPGYQYLVDFRESISVPAGACAIIIGRSSLLRGGILVTSALWDSGFQGRLGASIRPLNHVRIEYGARLAQVVFMQAQSGHLYSGRYQNAHTQEV